jgi:hypothetical protein
MQRITEETFRILVNAGSVRKITLQPAPWNGKDRWAVVLKLGTVWRAGSRPPGLRR